MAEEWKQAAIGVHAGSPLTESVFSQLKNMSDALWGSRERVRIILLFVALVAVVGATAYAQVRLNAWNEPFYDALAHKRVSEFLAQLVVFAELAGLLLTLNVAQTWLNQKSKLILRKGLVDDLMTQWLSPLRAFRLSHGESHRREPGSADP